MILAGAFVNNNRFQLAKVNIALIVKDSLVYV